MCTLAASESKVYNISSKGLVRSVPDAGSIDHTSIFMQGHYDVINQVVFPGNYASVFATCSRDEIRVWGNSGKELLKIELTTDSEFDQPFCNCIELMSDGKSIVSGWTDGRMRAFLPQSGKLYWIVDGAHSDGGRNKGGVMTLCTTKDCENVLSSGTDGELKLWNIGKQVKTCQSSQKMHQAQITSIKMVNDQDTEVATSSLDGTIILWKLQKLRSLQKLQHVMIPSGVAADSFN